MTRHGSSPFATPVELMRLFHRTSIIPADIITLADAYFKALGMQMTPDSTRARTFAGELGTLQLKVRSDGGHYTFVEAATDQIGESRLDKNVKKFFNQVHRAADPHHVPTAGY
jgi:hypothetical protein